MRRYTTAAASTSTAHHGQSYQSQSHAAVAATAATTTTGNDLLDFAHWYEPTGVRRRDPAPYSATNSRHNSSIPSTSYLTGSRTFRGGGDPYRTDEMRSPGTTLPSTTATNTTSNTLGGIVATSTITHEPSSPIWQHSFPTGRGTATFAPTNAAIATVASPPNHSNSFTATSSPWSANASVSVTLGPGGFEGESSSSSARSTAYYQHHHPSAPPAVAMMDAWGNNNSFLTGEEEEEMLSTMSTMSPSSYIRRLHRELEQGGGGGGLDHDGMHIQRQDRLGRQYEVNTSHRPLSSDEATLSSMMPSDVTPLSIYLGRLRRECERDNQQRLDRMGSRQHSINSFGRGTTTTSSAAHHCPTSTHPFSASAAATTTASTEPSLNPFHPFSTSNDLFHINRGHNSSMYDWNNSASWLEAGRTVETALEIADSDNDDDVVEVIDVEAMP
jgi:hypothetical protein